MFTKVTLFILAVAWVPKTVPPVVKPADEIQDGPQAFCCESVEGGTGEGCVISSGEPYEACEAVLHCESTWWWVDDGVVICG